jgi:hypothetical protein
MDEFWTAIDEQISALQAAESATDVIAILNQDVSQTYGEIAADGFFAGSGGDQSVSAALEAAGWSYLWSVAGYHWAMKAPDGSLITYVEGDVYIGNRRPLR